MTTKQAAQYFGITADAVRKRLKAGQLEGVQLVNRRGRPWDIKLPHSQRIIVKHKQGAPIAHELLLFVLDKYPQAAAEFLRSRL